MSASVGEVIIWPYLLLKRQHYLLHSVLARQQIHISNNNTNFINCLQIIHFPLSDELVKKLLYMCLQE